MSEVIDGAGHWDRIQQSLGYKASRPHLGFDVDDAISLLLAHAIEPLSVIDYACGAGHLATNLAAQFPGTVVTGLDIDPEAIVSARSRSRAMGVEGDCNFTAVDLRKWIPLQTFDLVCFAAVGDLFEDADSMALKARQLASSNGSWLVDASWAVSDSSDEANSWGKRLNQAAERAGFSLIGQRRRVEVEEAVDRVRVINGLLDSEEHFASQFGLQRESVHSALERLSKIVSMASLVIESDLWLFRMVE